MTKLVDKTIVGLAVTRKCLKQLWKSFIPKHLAGTSTDEVWRLCVHRGLEVMERGKFLLPTPHLTHTAYQ